MIFVDKIDIYGIRVWYVGKNLSQFFFSAGGVINLIPIILSPSPFLFYFNESKVEKHNDNGTLLIRAEVKAQRLRSIVCRAYGNFSG